MEVHHHAHARAHSSWKHYLFEFLMLFLAITLGFFVENLREEQVEKKRERQFLRSYLRDLNMDVKELDSLIQARRVRSVQLDSLTFILNEPDPDAYGAQAYYFTRYLPRPFQYLQHDHTFQQLKGSGNFRLIDDQAIADTMIAYDLRMHFIQIIQDRENYLVQRNFDFIDQLFDPAVFDRMLEMDIVFKRPVGTPKLRSKNKEVIDRFLSQIHYLRTVNNGCIGWFVQQRDNAVQVGKFIQERYELGE